MTDRSEDDRRQIAWLGVALTIGITVAGFLLVGLFSLWRCGFLSSGLPGTLSQDLCRGSTGNVLFAIGVLAPVLIGLAGTARAAASRDVRRLRLPLAAAAAVPTGMAVLYLVSGSV